MPIITPPTTTDYTANAGFNQWSQPRLTNNRLDQAGVRNVGTGLLDGNTGTRPTTGQQFPRSPYRNQLTIGQTVSPDVIGSRASLIYTTASLTNGSTDQGIVALGKGFFLISISTSTACRVTLYATAAARIADIASGRAFSTIPTPGSGIIADFLTTVPGQTIINTPATLGFNADNPASTNIYLAVNNTSGATATIAITFVRAIAEV